MKRNTPLIRKKPMKRGGKPLARSKLAQVSPKLAKANVAYAAAKKQWRAGHDGRCEVRFCLEFSPTAPWKLSTERTISSHPSLPDPLGRCRRRADNSPHHMAGRGPNLSRIETFLGVCRQCHEWIHANAREARSLGYLK